MNGEGTIMKANVTFGLFRAEEIRKRSVQHITQVDDHGGRGGVSDIALGPTRNALCPIDGRSDCVGHFGHTELKEPVFNVEFITVLHRCLQSCCWECGQLLLPPDASRWTQVKREKTFSTRLSALARACVERKYCESEEQRKAHLAHKPLPDDSSVPPAHRYCGARQPLWEKDYRMLIRPIFLLDGSSDPTAEFPRCTPMDIYLHLRMITDQRPEVLRLLGLCPENSPLDGMMWKALLIPPNTIRIGTSRSDDDITIRLRNILKARNKLETKEDPVSLARYRYLGKTFSDPVALLESRNDADVSPSYVVWLQLQGEVGGMAKSDIVPPGNKSGGQGKELASIRSKHFTGKENLIRWHCNAKRTDFSGRSVLIMHTDLHIRDIGIPRRMCMKWTYPVTVQFYNEKDLTARVRRGPHHRYGAQSIVYVDDVGDTVEMDLRFVDPSRVILQRGWIVKRFLIKGDVVLFNRQPTLHKQSIMAHLVHPIDTKSIALHMAVTKPYNADFDGDTGAITVPQSEEARAEALELMLVDHNIMKDNHAIVTFVQHAVMGICSLIEAGPLEADRVHEMMSRTSVTPIRRSMTGRALFESMLPVGIHCPEVLTAQGTIRMDQPVSNHWLNRKLLKDVWLHCGGPRCADWISDMYQLAYGYILQRGMTVHYDQLRVDQPPEYKKAAERAIDWLDSRPSPTDATPQEEADTCMIMERMRDLLSIPVLSQLGAQPKNDMMHMTKWGVKGNIVNVKQMAAQIGQTYNHRSERFPDVTYHQARKSVLHGAVLHSYVQGMHPVEYLNHSRNARGGLCDTSVKTSETGYTQRKLIKGMEDVAIRNGRVAYGNGQLVELVYGGDGWDASYLKSYTVPTLDQGDATLAPRHHGQPWLPEKVALPFDLLHCRDQDPDPPWAGWREWWLQFHAWHPLMVYYALSVCRTGSKQLATRLQEAMWRAQIHEGTPVGILAGQQIGETVTQMTLKTFHFIAVKMDLVGGVERLREIVNVVAEPKTPLIHITLSAPDPYFAMTLGEFVPTLNVTYQRLASAPTLSRTIRTRIHAFLDIKNPHLMMRLDPRELVPRRLTPRDVAHVWIGRFPGMAVAYAHWTSDQWWVALEFFECEDDPSHIVKVVHQLRTVPIQGIHGIKGAHQKSAQHVTAVGSGFGEILQLPRVDATQTWTSDIRQVASLLGVDAAQQLIINEIIGVGQTAGTSIHYRHVALLAQRMCQTGTVRPCNYSGMSHCTPLQLASFEHVMNSITEAAVMGTTDHAYQHPTGATMTGGIVNLGTGVVHLVEDPQVKHPIQMSGSAEEPPIVFLTPEVIDTILATTLTTPDTITDDDDGNSNALGHALGHALTVTDLNRSPTAQASIVVPLFPTLLHRIVWKPTLISNGRSLRC